MVLSFKSKAQRKQELHVEAAGGNYRKTHPISFNFPGVELFWTFSFDG